MCLYALTGSHEDTYASAMDAKEAVLKDLWNKHSKLIIIGAVVVALAVAGVLTAVFTGGEVVEEEPVEVTSAWPVAELERVISRPPEPARWPLTGVEAIPADAPANTRIVSVKIENSPASRPQTGLDQADIVYETLTEGGITRFNALFHSQEPPELGPVRSARMSDTQLVPQYAALFANSGGNTGVIRAIRSAGIDNLDHGSTGAAYWRARDRSAPHNLYVALTRIREAAAARGLEATQRLEGLAFSPAFDSVGSVTRLTVPFSPANSVVWSYDAAANTYLRANNGSPHRDRASGNQYAARNVVVMWAKTSATGPSGIGGATLEISLVGNGRASIFRDGGRVDCTWEAAADKPPVFRDAEGRILRLGPGQTWFQVVSTDTNIVME